MSSASADIGKTCSDTLTIDRLDTVAAIRTLKKIHKSPHFFESLSAKTLEHDGILEFRISPHWVLNSVETLARLPKFLGGELFSNLRQRLPTNFVIVADPEVTRDVLHNPQAYNRGYESLSNTLGKSSILIKENSQPEQQEEWQVAHRAMVGSFSPQFIRDHYVPIIREELQFLEQRWNDKASTQGLVLAAQEDLDIFGIQVGFRSLLDTEIEDEDALKLIPVFQDVFKMASPEATRFELQALVERILKNRNPHAQKVQKLIDRLILTRTENDLPAEWVFDQLITVLFASQETTRFTLAMSLAELARRPEWQNRIYDGGEKAADAFLKNVLRLHPPVPMIPRLVLKDQNPGGYNIRRGTVLEILPYAQHRNPKVWGPKNSETFFDGEKFDQVDKYAMCGFGGGMRMCIGMTLAMTELKMFLLDIVEKWIIDGPAELPTIELGAGVMRTAGNIDIHLRRREP